MDLEGKQNSVTELAETSLIEIRDESNELRPDNFTGGRGLRQGKTCLFMLDKESELRQPLINPGIHQLVVILALYLVDLPVEDVVFLEKETARIPK